MSGYSSKVKEIAKKEQELNLSKESVLGVPIWRILRFKTRTKYFKKTTGFNNKSNSKSVKPFFLLRRYVTSFYKISKLFIGNKTYKNVVYAFPRLAKLDGIYLDKFTDPVIKYSNIKYDVLIFQKTALGKQLEPRAHQQNLVETDFIDLTARAVSILLFPLFALAYGKRVKKVYKKAQPIFQLPKSFLIVSIISLGDFYLSYAFHKQLLKKLKVKNTFVVNRSAFSSQIVASRKVNAKTYEFQHGVTMADTILYTGQYHPIIDPDYFLAFGEKWKTPQFYIPLDKIVNIGWAYKKETKEVANKFKENTHDILIISSPGCTFMLFDLVCTFAQKHPDRTFYIRLHPQEAYQQKQLKTIQSTPNIQIEPNQIDSAIIVNLYQHIVGENSSVLFEALCAGKKVARLDMGGLDIKDEGGILQKGFYYLKSIQDFDAFLKDKSLGVNEDLGIYDDFKEETINRLIE